MDKIWQVMKGERGEGGHVLRTHLSHGGAVRTFEWERQQLADQWNREIDSAAKNVSRPDGSRYFEIGCDWLSLGSIEVLP